MNGGSQWPPHSLWQQVAVVLLVWAPVEDWEAVDGSPDSIEKASQAVTSHLQDGAAWTVAGTMGWIFLTALKVNMDSALRDAAQVCKLLRWEEELEQRIHMLEQEMHGPEEPSTSHCEVVRTVMMSIVRPKLPTW